MSFFLILEKKHLSLHRVIFLLFFIPWFSFGQNSYEITWGEENLKRSNLVDLLPDSSLNFYTFQYSNSAILPYPKVARYVDGREVVTKKIDQRLDENTVNLEDILTFNGRLIGFFSDKRGSLNSLFLQEFDTEIDPIGPVLELSNYVSSKSWSKGVFHISVSENQQFLCVEYEIPGKKEQFDHFGYSIFNVKLNLIRKGEYDIPTDAKNTVIETRHLTNEGEYLIGVSLFSNQNNGVWKDYSSVLKTMIYQVASDSLITYDLMFDDRRVYNFAITSKDEIAVITGTYGEQFTSGARGVFFQRISLNSRKVLNQKIMEFPSFVLTEESEQNKILEASNRDYYMPLGADLVNYAFRNVSMDNDGSFTVVAEQFYIFQQSNSDPRGMMQFVNHYYYDDCIIYKIDSTGAFSWFVKLPKEQHSTNDYGYYSSVKTVRTENQLILFFNDHIKNYTDFGEFIALNRSFNFPVRKNQYALVSASVDLKTGTVDRRMNSSYDETQGFVSLKMSKYNPLKNQFLLISSGKRERFGIMQF